MKNAILIAASVAALSFAALGAAHAADLKPLKLVKECSAFTGKSGDHCTITESNFDGIPVGSLVIYYGPVIGPVILASTILVDDGKGDTAIGTCNVNLVESSGSCAFWAGSGKLAGFNGLVALTIDGKGLFHWDGGYTIASAL